MIADSLMTLEVNELHISDAIDYVEHVITPGILEVASRTENTIKVPKIPLENE